MTTCVMECGAGLTAILILCIAVAVGLSIFIAGMCIIQRSGIYPILLLNVYLAVFATTTVGIHIVHAYKNMKEHGA